MARTKAMVLEGKAKRLKQRPRQKQEKTARELIEEAIRKFKASLNRYDFQTLGQAQASRNKKIDTLGVSDSSATSSKIKEKVFNNESFSLTPQRKKTIVHALPVVNAFALANFGARVQKSGQHSFGP
jgi:CRISPR/Cas system-associated endonuclease/helicase Cas3